MKYVSGSLKYISGSIAALVIVLLASSIAFPQVMNFVMFIGQAVAGSTAGAPLAVDSNNQLISGLTVSVVSATSSTTTTSTSDVLMTTLTETPGAGSYIALCGTTLQENSNNANVFVSIYSNNAQSSGSERSGTPQIQGGLTPSLNQNVPIFTFSSVTVAAAQTVECRWRVSAGTATALSRMLLLLRWQ